MAEMGRPPIFESPEDMQDKIDKFFIWVQGEKGSMVNVDGQIVQQWNRYPEPATITGLALFLGFESRQSVYDYAEKGDFSYIIKKAKLRVECEYEKKLSAQNCTGSIFALKNMGWKDRSEIEHSGNKINLHIVRDSPATSPEDTSQEPTSSL